MKKIAITGGIGSGKSTVADYIRELGYPVFSCDEIYKEIIRSPQYIEQIRTLFPDVVIDGAIDRAALSARVFSDEGAREKLNAVAHPLIMKSLFEKMQASEQNLVFAEVPLLYEGNYAESFDGVLIVERDKRERIKAVRARDKTTMERVLARMASQIDYDGERIAIEKQKPNVVSLKNQGGQTALRQAVNELISTIRET